MKHSSTIYFGIAVFTFFIGFFVGYKNCPHTGSTVSTKYVTLKMKMRRVWSDQIFLIKNYIISSTEYLGDATVVIDYLMVQQEEIGNLFIPFYGKNATKKLIQLLKNHIQYLTEVIATTKNNNVPKLLAVQKKWYSNASELSIFFITANSYFKEIELMKMIHSHLVLIQEMIDLHCMKEWKEEMELFEKLYEQVLNISDYLIDGLFLQFPDKF